jgi:phosphoenolpyruvate-protein kinase (PTS system EI component)
MSHPQEIAAVVKQHFAGVGLFRTEFLFIDSTEPTIDRQVAVYASMARQLGGRPLVIRTFDLQRETIPQFLLHEPSPAAGALHLNGLRFSLAERHMFDNQVAAILKVAQNENIRILLPMVIGSDDLSEAVARIERLAERYKLARTPPIGAMIETPAALFGLDEILDLADFLSLGTNDLTQFMLATDREAMDSHNQCGAMHPAVLRAIKQVCDAAKRRQCPLSVCGEAVGEVAFASLMIGMGIRELSIAGDCVAPIRHSLRALDTHAASHLATQALACRSLAEVLTLVESWQRSAKNSP